MRPAKESTEKEAPDIFIRERQRMIPILKSIGMTRKRVLYRKMELPRYY